MTTHADFEDFFRLLNEHGVEYMIVGGYAVAYHGYPRFTKDVDVFYANTRVNAQRLQSVLVAFGFQASSIPLEVIEKPNAVLSIGLEPVRIDLLNAIAGVLFEEAWPNVVAGRYGRHEGLVHRQGRAASEQAIDRPTAGSRRRRGTLLRPSNPTRLRDGHPIVSGNLPNGRYRTRTYDPQLVELVL